MWRGDGELTEPRVSLSVGNYFVPLRMAGLLATPPERMRARSHVEASDSPSHHRRVGGVDCYDSRDPPDDRAPPSFSTSRIAATRTSKGNGFSSVLWAPNRFAISR
jgi:hypothetical protein